MDDDEGTAFVGSSPSQSGTAQTLHLWVVPRGETVVWSVMITRLFAVVLVVGVSRQLRRLAACWW